MTAIDIVLVLALAGSFILGFFLGVVRGGLAVAAWLVAFVLGANLRAPVGDYLSRQWANIAPAYVHMLAFAIGTVVVFGILMTIILFGAKGPRGFSSYPLFDDLLGGLLGALLGILVLASVIVMLVSLYGPLIPGAGAPIEADYAAQLFRALAESAIGRLIADTVVPLMGILLGPLVPEAVREAMA